MVGCSVNKPHSYLNRKTKSKYTNLYTQKYDGGPASCDEIPNLRLIQDPIPKYEPKSRYGNPSKYKVFNRTYKVLPSSNGYAESGKASWYGTKFHGFRTSSGEIYDMYKMTAAHKTLPLPTYAKVINLANNRSVIVKINDRGPFHADRILDLSYVAASKLGILPYGVGKVKVIALPLKSPVNTKVKCLPKETLNLANNTKIIDNKLITPKGVQVGAFKFYENANKLAKNLEKLLKNSDKNVVKTYKINILNDSLQTGDKKNILYRVVVSSEQGQLDQKYLNEILLGLKSTNSAKT